MDIFYSILNVVAVIVLIVFITCFFMKNKLFKQAILIELVTSVIMLIINIITLIMEFYMKKSIISTVAFIFLWLIISIDFAIRFGKTTEKKDKKKLQQIEKKFVRSKKYWC